MIKIKETVFSGNVFANEAEELTVVIYSDYSIHDIARFVTDVDNIIYYTNDEDEQIYNVTHVKSCTEVSHHVYAVKFSTKPTLEEEMMAQIVEQNAAIDALLAMILEG